MFDLEAQHDAPDLTLHFDKEKVTLYDIIKQFESKEGLEVVYSINTIELDSLICLHKSQYNLTDLIEEIQKQQNILIESRGNRLIFIGNYLSFVGEDFRKISGFVQDGNTREPLMGASIALLGQNIGTYTDQNGYFVLRLPDELIDSTILSISFVGYEAINKRTDEVNGMSAEFLLFPNAFFQEILIAGYLKESDETSSVTRTDGVGAIHFLPGSLGGNDLFKEMAMLPGVNRGNDFQTGIAIRGLPPSNTQYLLDGLPLYEPNHAFGLFSVIKQSSISQIALYKGFTPLNFPGRISGVVNQQLKVGNSMKAVRIFEITPAAICLNWEGPVIRQRTSYSIGIRRSIIDYYLPRVIEKFTEFSEINPVFYDLNFKVAHRLNARNSLEMIGFISNDKFSLGQKTDLLDVTNKIAWNNQILGLSWKGVLGDRFVNKMQLGLSHYDSDKQFNVGSVTQNPFKFYFQQIAQSYVSDITFNQNASYFLSNDLEVSLGFQSVRHLLKPLVYKSVFADEPTEDPILEPGPDSLSWDLSSYLLFRWKIPKVAYLEPGIQLNYYKPEGENAYVGFNPCLKTEIYVGKQSKISSILQRTHQNIHLLSNQQIGMASDLWIPAGNGIPPQHMWQWTLGYFYDNKDNWNCSVEAYWRKMDGLIDYAGTADLYDPSLSDGTVIPVFNDPTNWQDKLKEVSGISYGLEISWNFFSSPLMASASYTYGKTNLSMKEDQSYPGNYDFRHCAHMFLQYRIHDHWMSYINWYFHTGGPYTLPIEGFVNQNNEWILGFTSRNNQRYRPYHTGSLGIKYRNLDMKYPLALDFGLRNIYNNANPVYVYLSSIQQQLEVRQVNGLPIYPFVKCGLTF